MFDRKRFKAAMIMADVTSKDLAKALEINESTLYRKLNAGGEFTRKEINKLIEILNIEDPKEIFFASELAET